MLLGRSKPKSFMVPCSCVSWELEKSPGFGWWAGGLLGRKKVGNLWIRDSWMSRMFVGKTMGTRSWCLSFSMFVCKKMSPPNGEANLSCRKTNSESGWKDVLGRWSFLWDFWPVFRGYLWLVLLIQPTTNLETLGDYVLKRINKVWIFHWDFLKENPAAKEGRNSDYSNMEGRLTPSPINHGSRKWS